MDDLISRQAAIDAIERKAYRHTYIEQIVDILNSMPSAQPDIIRCKEWKYRGETEDGEYNPEDIVCTYWMSDGLSETDYCSYAERRTDGKTPD